MGPVGVWTRGSNGERWGGQISEVVEDEHGQGKNVLFKEFSVEISMSDK